MELLGDVGLVESHFFLFGDSVSVGDRCTVCAKRTIGSEIILDAPFGTTRSQGSSESSFVSVQDCCMVCARHAIGLESVVDALDGTTR